MILSKNTSTVNDFIFSGNTKPKSHFIDYKRVPVRTLLLTPNRLLATGLIKTFENKDLVDFIKVSTSALGAIVHWQEQPHHAFPELLMLDTLQRAIECIEIIQRFKVLNLATKILVMGDQFRDEKIEQYFYHGAEGYIDQSANVNTFCYAIDILIGQKQKFFHTPTLPFNGYFVANSFSD